MSPVVRWTGRQTKALRQARRLSIRAFAEHLGVATGSVVNWERRGEAIRLRGETQEILDRDLSIAPDEVRNRFEAALLTMPRHRHTSDDVTETALRMDGDGNVWAQVDRRAVLVGSVALAATRLVPEVNPTAGPASLSDPYGFADALSRHWPDLRLSRPVPDYGVDLQLLLPGGRSMLGAGAAVQVLQARTVAGRVLATLPDAKRAAEFLRGPGRRLLVGADTAAEVPRYYLLDVLHLRDAGAEGTRSEVPVPVAYELDDLTIGVLWAAANLDDALQADDRPLCEARSGLSAYERQPASTVGREAAPGLNPVAHQWLGSDFCARHVLRTLPDLPAVPAFWTREQRGEEASAWLLFGHKYDYLRQTMALIGSPVARAFCVPEDAVRESPRSERVLLFLAFALMESLGIRVQVTDEPAYGNVEGFVVAPGRQAIVANWVRGDGIWHVDATSRAGVVRDFTEVVSDVAASTLLAAPSPAGRLRLLAGYLGLDWAWLTGRCQGLARAGTAGLVRPRSRLISTAGLDAACAFVGSLPASA